MVSRMCRLSEVCRPVALELSAPKLLPLFTDQHSNRDGTQACQKIADLKVFCSWLPDPRQIAIEIALLGYTSVLLSPRCKAVCAGASIVCFPVPAVRLAAQRRWGTSRLRQRGSRRRARDVEAPPQSTHLCDTIFPAGADASMHACVRPYCARPQLGFVTPPASQGCREQKQNAAAEDANYLLHWGGARDFALLTTLCYIHLYFPHFLLHVLARACPQARHIRS